jgi:GNAT superfamily N-acetyltransferase
LCKGGDVGTTSPTVRLARADDAPTLRDIYRDASWSNVGDRELIAAHPEWVWSDEWIAQGQTSVAEVDGRIAGFITLVSRHGVLEIEDLFVDPPSMRAGVGTMLVDHARTEAVRQRLSLEVDANVHAVAFYTAVGFVEHHEVAQEHGTAIRMVADLRRLA